MSWRPTSQLIVNAESSPSSWIWAIRSPQSTRVPASAKPSPSVRSRMERGTSEVQRAIWQSCIATT